MAIINTTRWSPDTCGCILEYTWDSSLPADQIVTTPANVVKKCSVHSALTDSAQVFSTVQEENPRKNNAYQTLLDNGPAILVDTMPDGTKTLKEGLNIGFSLSGSPPNRLLTITLTGITLTTNQKNTAQTFLNNRFGVGRVTLVNG